jgi:hypothetical protein
MYLVLSLHAALEHLLSVPWHPRAARLALLGLLGVASGCCSVARQSSSAHFLRALREGNLAAVKTLCQKEPKWAERGIHFALVTHASAGRWWRQTIWR